MRKTFYQDGLAYEAQLTSAGEFAFNIIGGSSQKQAMRRTKRDRYDLFYEELLYGYGDLDCVSAAMPVYKKAGEILIEWIFSKRPWRVFYSASTARKIRVYRWLSQKLLRRLSDQYSFIEFPEGHFEFYRAMETPSQFV